MTDFSIENVLTGWETDGVLGSGAFGTVYLAHTVIEDKPVYNAVKVVRVPPTPEAISAAENMGISRDLLKTYFEKFKSDLNWELTMFGTARDKHLVHPEEFKAVDSESAGWVGYIRYPVATPLSSYFEKVEATNEDAARLGYELSRALGVLFENDLTHGDVTPDNVLVADNGSFLLTDYAIKRTLEKAGSGLFRRGEDDFEAPELADERVYTPACDVYSLGRLMEFVATDCGGEQKIDPALQKIIDRATAEDPAERPTAAELHELIEKSKLLGERKSPRRAVAAVSSFDLVKRNGSGIRSQRGEEPYTPVEKIKYPNDVPTKKKSRKVAIKIASVIICAVLVVGVVAVAVLNPFAKPDPADTDPTPATQNTDTPKSNDTPVIIEDPATSTQTPGDVTNTDVPPENNDDPNAGNQENSENQNPGVSEDPNNNNNNDPDVGTPAEAGTYLFPSDTVLMKESDVDGKNRTESYLLINELYARHGLTFKTDTMREYFESQPWYRPDSSKTAAQIEAEFNEIEKANLKLLTEYQKDMGYR